jgi:hypothetical protein
MDQGKLLTAEIRFHEVQKEEPGERIRNFGWGAEI